MTRVPTNTAVALLLAVAVGLLAACGEVDPGFVIDESSGVPVVENYRPAWGERPAWTVALAPELAIPQWSMPEPQDSFHLTDAKRLPDGTLVVADGFTGELRFVDDRGQPIRSIGGKGLEPGKFQRLSTVHVIDGSLWALDRMGRWNVFDFRGDLLATLYFEPQGSGWSSVAPFGQEMAVLASSSCCGSPPTESGWVRPPASILRYELTGAAIDTLALVPGLESYVEVARGRTGVLMTPFSHYPVMQGGRRFLYYGAGDRMEIEVFGGERRRVRVIRIPDFDLSVTDAQWEAETARIRDLPRRRTRPAYGRFLEDAEENLWVADFDPSTARRGLPPSNRWTVFNPEGRWLGSVETPAGLAVTEIGGDYVLGIARVDGHSVVELHALSR